MTAFIRSLVTKSLVFAMLCGGMALAAQPVLNAQRTQAAAPEGEDLTAAQRVRDEFMNILRKYPPTVGHILKLDPTLMSSEPYMAAYPAITTFVNAHPEIRRSPAFYFEPVRTGSDGYYYDPRERAWNDSMEWIGVSVIFITIAGSLAWLVRTAVDYRRWGRLAKVQAEAHTKLLDRFTGNDELLAYVQSSAGARFLKSSPIALDGNSKPIGAPLGRILWSMNAGLVLAAGGIGLNYVSHRIDPYRADPIFMFSTLALSIGLGFLVSAVASYMLSRRLGLLGNPAASEED